MHRIPLFYLSKCHSGQGDLFWWLTKQITRLISFWITSVSILICHALIGLCVNKSIPHWIARCRVTKGVSVNCFENDEIVSNKFSSI